MPSLTILPQGTTVAAEPGTTILAALLAAGIDLAHKCSGNAKCGTCHLFIQEGRKTISRLTPEENAKLDTLVGIGSKSRLACQAKLGTENVTVELLGFKSGF